MHFFDYNATTPLFAEAKHAWLEASDFNWYNPSSPYRIAAQVQVRLEAARQELAALLGVETGRLIFNSGATEGNNSIFAHWAEFLPADAKVGVSPTEHPSVLEAAQRYFAGRVVLLSLDSHGAVDLDRLGELFERESLAAVSVMAANNETGIINPWRAIAELCQGVGCHYHCDASQWVGKMPTVGLAECSFVTGCGHKFGAPRGIGFLVLPDANYRFLSLVGGAQEGGRRAGTESVSGVMAMLAALRTVSGFVPQLNMNGFLSCLTCGVPGATVVGLKAERLWNTVSVLMPEFTSVRWIRALERRGFLVSAGSACSTGMDGGSHVLSAMGFAADEQGRVLRISSGWKTSESDLDALFVALIESYEELQFDRSSSGARVISI
jgi:cysteine desulfurase